MNLRMKSNTGRKWVWASGKGELYHMQGRRFEFAIIFAFVLLEGGRGEWKDLGREDWSNVGMEGWMMGWRRDAWVE